MNKVLTEIQKLKKNLELIAFLVSKGGSEREAHGRVVESLVILSQLEITLGADSYSSNYSSDFSDVSVSSPLAARSESRPPELKNEVELEIKKVTRRLPRWFRNPSQLNSTILLNFLILYEQFQDVSVKALRSQCAVVNDFDGNYNQMKNFGEKNHGKVFEERDGYVTLWAPVKKYILDLYSETIREKRDIGDGVKNLYSENEIILCTYIARFGRNDFSEKDIVKIKNRSLDSIRMKVQNIAAMLNEAGVETSDQISKLTGLPAGQTGRKTNWSQVKQCLNLSHEEHKSKCINILENPGQDADLPQIAPEL